MAKYVSLREAKEQRKEQKRYAAAGDPKAVKQEAKILGRQLLIKDCLAIITTLVTLIVVVGSIVGISSSQGGGTVVVLWPIYIVFAVIISLLFALFGNHLHKKMKEIKKYKISLKATFIITWVATILCILIPVVLIIVPVCFLLNISFFH